MRNQRSSQRGLATNREIASFIEAISAAGDFIEVPDLPDAARIAVTDKDYSNDEIAFGWLKFFEEHTRNKSSSLWRIQIVDGHGSHHTYDFIDYAEKNKIMIFGLPPELTHLHQPLDVVKFSSIKHHYSEAIE
ncbi:DDE superfamily endonuclease domain-containing protein [Cordyceps javanica]|nr:DDE superfamily endonuclease domain-containing protein [Cordyceps javanica]